LSSAVGRRLRAPHARRSAGACVALCCCSLPHPSVCSALRARLRRCVTHKMIKLDDESDCSAGPFIRPSITKLSDKRGICLMSTRARAAARIAAHCEPLLACLLRCALAPSALPTAHAFSADARNIPCARCSSVFRRARATRGSVSPSPLSVARCLLPAPASVPGDYSSQPLLAPQHTRLRAA
jgi:hypothetical protein